MIDIPKRIKELTQQKNISSINELSRLADVPQSTLATIMLGRTSPRADTLDRICQALGISLSEFFAVKEEEKIINHPETIIKHAETMELSPEQQAALKEYKNMPPSEQQQRLIKAVYKLKSLSVGDLEALLKIIDSIPSSPR